METESLSVVCENGTTGGGGVSMTVQKYEHHGHFTGSLKDEVVANFAVPRMAPLTRHGGVGIGVSTSGGVNNNANGAGTSANASSVTATTSGPPPFKEPPQMPHNRRPIGLLPTSVHPPRDIATPVLPGAPDTHSNPVGFSWSQNATNRTLVEDGVSARIPTLSQVTRQQRGLNGHSENGDYPPNKIEAWTSQQTTVKTSRPISERIGSFQTRLKSLLNGTDSTRKVEKFQKPADDSPPNESSSTCNGVENPAFHEYPLTELTNSSPSAHRESVGCPVTTSTPMLNDNSTAALTNAIERLNITGFRQQQQQQTPQYHRNEEHINHQNHNNIINNQHQQIRDESGCNTQEDGDDPRVVRDYQRLNGSVLPPHSSSSAHNPNTASNLQLSDICNKRLFGRDQAIHYGNNTLTLVNESRNFKRPLNVEKVTPKEQIGQLGRGGGGNGNGVQENAPLYSRYGLLHQQQQQQLQHQLHELENSALNRDSLRGTQALNALLGPNFVGDQGNPAKTIESQASEMTIPKWETRGNWSPQICQNDPGSDQGKSSSDSGRVTGTPGFMTPKEDDTSLWSTPDFGNYKGGIDHHSGGSRHPDRESELSSALSLTPPLPPVTPPTSSGTPSESPLPNLKTIKYKVTSERCQDSRTERGDEASKGSSGANTGTAEGASAQGPSTAAGSSSAPFARHLGSVREKAALAVSMDDLGQSEAGGLWSSPARLRQWPRSSAAPTRSANQFASCEMLDSNCGSKFGGKKQKFPSRLTLQSDPHISSSFPDLDMTSCVDTESVLDDDDDDDCESSVMTEDVSTKGTLEVQTIRRQLEGLETMYSEILKMLGVRSQRPRRRNMSVSSADDYGQRSSRGQRGNQGSFSPLNLAAAAAAKGRPPRFRDPRGPKGGGTPHHHHHGDKRRSATSAANRESKSNSVSKRLQRLESHVVTLARSVAHVSSEMRTQHVLFQELETIRRDVNWTQEALKQMGHRPGSRVGGGGAASRSGRRRSKDWDVFRGDMLELINPSRVRKLTKFFGDEPPLLRQFLKKLGYEKYASNFENEKIGITELPYLTEDKLQKIGIPMGPRARILEETQHSFRQDQYKIYIV